MDISDVPNYRSSPKDLPNGSNAKVSHKVSAPSRAATRRAATIRTVACVVDIRTMTAPEVFGVSELF